MSPLLPNSKKGNENFLGWEKSAMKFSVYEINFLNPKNALKHHFSNSGFRLGRTRSKKRWSSLEMMRSSSDSARTRSTLARQKISTAAGANLTSPLDTPNIWVALSVSDPLATLGKMLSSQMMDRIFHGMFFADQNLDGVSILNSSIIVIFLSNCLPNF